MTDEPKKVEIEIDIDENYEEIILTIQTDERQLVLSLTSQEAQVLSYSLGEAATKLIMYDLGLATSSLPPETKH